MLEQLETKDGLTYHFFPLKELNIKPTPIPKVIASFSNVSEETKLGLEAMNIYDTADFIEATSVENYMDVFNNFNHIEIVRLKQQIQEYHRNSVTSFDEVHIDPDYLFISFETETNNEFSLCLYWNEILVEYSNSNLQKISRYLHSLSEKINPSKYIYLEKKECPISLPPNSLHSTLPSIKNEYALAKTAQLAGYPIPKNLKAKDYCMMLAYLTFISK